MSADNSATMAVQTKEELMEHLAEMQDGDVSRPLILLLGKEEWAPTVHYWVEEQKHAQALRREPFVICTSVDSDRIGASVSNELFHAFLPRNFGQKDVKWSLEYCRLWWLTRSVEPYQKPAEQDHFSDEVSGEEELSDEEQSDDD